MIYRDELERLAAGGGLDLRLTLTRTWPEGWQGYRRRLDSEMLQAVSWPASERPLAYICGPTGFVELAADALVGLGHDPAQIRTERFGPTGR